jgi:hypothetical protein
MRLFRLAETLPAINWLQTVGSLERQHPPWILRGKRADLIQLPKLVLGECEFSRRFSGTKTNLTTSRGLHMTGFESYSQSIKVLRRLAVIRATTDKNALPERICEKRMILIA